MSAIFGSSSQSLAFMTYTPPGPVCSAFLGSDAGVRGIMGPIGSGKTGACLMDILYRGSRMPVGPGGVRRSRFAVIRDTYRNLKNTTLKSWFSWVPKEFGEFSGDDPATHRIRFRLPDGSILETEVVFIALGDRAIEDVLRGWEGTGAYINEADRLSPDVLIFLRGRVGRYPGINLGGCPWSGVWMDFNAPDLDNWTYGVFEENRPEGFRFFRQPSGLAPDAENINNLPPGYYQRQMEGQPDWYIRRMILNEWGYSRDGKPVFSEFRDSFHVASEPLRAIPDLPLIIGMDAGLTPAAVLGQKTFSGQWRVLRELVCVDMGAKKFGATMRQLLEAEYEPWLHKDFDDKYPISCWGDPAATARSATADDEKDWLSIVRGELRLPLRPAPSNSVTVRLEAVRGPLSRLIDGQPGFLLSPTCKILRKAFNSGYRYRRVAIAGGVRFADQPDKNEFSHPSDGLQYMLLGGGEHHVVMNRERSRQPAKAITMKTGFKVFS